MDLQAFQFLSPAEHSQPEDTLSPKCRIVVHETYDLHTIIEREHFGYNLASPTGPIDNDGVRISLRTRGTTLVMYLE
jgi:hypothetical protein